MLTIGKLKSLLSSTNPTYSVQGIKEKYVVQKYGIPLKQLHSYDYGGPYAAFGGAINFYQEMGRMLGTDIWKLVDAPWKHEPEIVGSVTVDA